MDIIVCIKQVPDTTDIKIDPATNTLIREGVESIINPFDMYAIEEAIRTKGKLGGKVTVVSMGPPQVDTALREAISLGCDEAVLLTDKAFAGSDTLATSYTLAVAIKKIGSYDVIFCGKQAADGDTAQVGPGISAHLDIPQVTYVKKIEQIQNGFARVERMTEEGYEVIETPLPALFTVVKEINEPRLPSLRGKIAAKKTKITTWNAKDLVVDEKHIGLNGSPTQVIKIFAPPPRAAGEIFHGDTEEVVLKLVERIKDELKPKF
ncbi:MAG: electron transfer flavoprotein subunit beta/FixA family protein [Candidatus Omnitrophota bacterium]|nr:MAG: electron transfer flavoprotein subunit beta/FixA family protein [Candidatus Omnitrophota bacterium]